MMSPERWTQVRALFDQALDLPSSARASFPDSANTDPDIWRAVRELIDAHDRLASSDPALEPVPLSVFENGQLVAGRYRILYLRGRGGMGEVYKVFDERLRITIGLKTVRFDWSAHQDQLARFEREVRIAREVSHPNLCRVFDLIEHRSGAESFVCLTMEWLDGETLEEHLQHSRPWSPAAALPILSQIAAALDALHAAGIVHRDLKPGNIILVPSDRQQWRATVTDFGLAKPSSWNDAYESRVDAQAGAPYFMAPEQLENKKLSPASDIYAFGLLIDEIVCTSRAFDGESIASIYYQKLRGQPIPPSRRNPSIPRHWDRTILLCLDRSPSNRFASAADAVRALRVPRTAVLHSLQRFLRTRGPFLLLALVLPLLALFCFFAFVLPRPAVPVTVFRIRDLTADPESNYLSTGLTAELINQLIKLDGVTIKPFRGLAEGNALQKTEDRFLLDGDLQKHAHRIRLNLRLSDRQNGGAIVWADSVDRDVDNPLALQSQVVSHLIPGLQSYLAHHPPTGGQVQLASLRLLSAAQTLWQAQSLPAASTQNPVAFHAHLRALHLLEDRRPESVRAAIQSLELAVREDPGFALAFASLADACRALLDMKQGSQEELRARALDYARKAVAFNPYLPEAHTSLAATLQLLWDWQGSEKSYREAIRLAPKSPAAYSRLGGLILQFGRFDEALDLYRKGLELDPYDYPAHSAYGRALQIARRPKEAEAHLKWTLSQRDFMSAHVNLGPVYALQGQTASSPAEAKRYFDLALAEAAIVGRMEVSGAPIGTVPKTPSSDYMFAMFHAMRGDSAAAQLSLQRMLLQQDMVRDSPISIALVYGMLRDIDKAALYLKEAAKVKDRGLLYLKVLPLWDPVRGHPTYAEIVSEMKL